ncbi:MAG: recombination-associated protein RdgC [Thiothrix sp.]|nr:recombination-associated protein RdgC [Thiothrix sp.]HPQ94063.1 recombination-associated protein RdgC [Thiolinea sp.]
MWFKNLYLYRLQKDFPLSAEQLHEQLQHRTFAPCTKDQRENSGWVSPLGRHAESMVHAVNGFILLSMSHQERMLPASVIREELEERVAELEERENRKIGGREKKSMREQIEFELLPRAFTRTRKLDAWIDTQNHWLVVNTASAAQAERLTGLLRKTIDSLPVSLPETSQSPGVLMTRWLTEGVPPAPFELGGECELRAARDETSVATFRNHELMGEDVQSSLAAGKQVSRLMLIWDRKISLMLGDDLLIRRLKFLDLFDEQLDEHDPQSQAERMDIEFTLMTAEVSRMLTDLFGCLNPAPET